MEPRSLLQSDLGACCLRHGCGVHELNRMALCRRAVASSSGLVAIARATSLVAIRKAVHILACVYPCEAPYNGSSESMSAH